MGFVQLGKRFYSTKGLFRVIWGSVGFAQFVQCFQACIGLVGFSKACYSVMMSMVSSLTAIPSRCSSPKARHTLWTLNPKPLNPKPYSRDARFCAHSDPSALVDGTFPPFRFENSESQQ